MTSGFLLPLEFPALFLTGLAFGTGICSISCLPVISACILGNSRKGADGLYAMASFSAGKLMVAAILGAVCAALGRVLLESIGTDVFSGASGLFTLVAGLVLILRPACATCGNGCAGQASPFLLGMASPFTPCLPYAAMMAAAAASGSAAKGAAIALVFTLGTSLSPLILIALAMGWVGAGMARKIPLHIRGLSRFAGVLIVFSGIRTLLAGFTGF